MNIKEPILIRASSLAGLFECPARWEAQNIRGLRTPSSGSARLGTAVHTSTALFDTSRMNGTGITPDEAAGAAVDAIHKPDEEVLWDEPPAHGSRTYRPLPAPVSYTHLTLPTIYSV